MRKAAIALLAVLLCATLAANARADCKLHEGDHVVLYGSLDDPDVFVWDTRVRLRDYHAASYDVAKQLTPHARLVTPGTRAIVQACVPDFVVSPIFEHPNDAIGIIIVTGPARGKAGWVMSSEIRGVYRAMPKRR